MLIEEYLRARRAEVEEALETVLPSPPDCPPVVADAMRYSLMAGGKRLRPILCLAGADTVGGDRQLAMPAACAIEMIHTYSLIHDDLPAMDNDTMRRGRPTLHVIAGEGVAILAGDGLLTEAFHLMACRPETQDSLLLARKLRVVRVVAHAAGPVGMVGGQAVDLESSAPRTAAGAAPLDADGLRQMHARKTGAMIRAAAQAGAIMGGGSEGDVAVIDRAAAELGLAFQIVDDILDVEGTTAGLGKTAGKDAAAGKLTYPSLFGLDRSRRMAAECLARAESSLEQQGIRDPHLLGIGRWIIDRTR